MKQSRGDDDDNQRHARLEEPSHVHPELTPPEIREREMTNTLWRRDRFCIGWVVLGIGMRSAVWSAALLLVLIWTGGGRGRKSTARDVRS